MTVLRARPGLLAWLAALLLGFNLLAATTLTARDTRTGDLARVTEVCTPNGMIFLGTDGNPIHTVPGDAICQDCLPMLHAAVALSAPPVLPPPAMTWEAAATPPPATVLLAHQRLPNSQPRAPPAA